MQELGTPFILQHFHRSSDLLVLVLVITPLEPGRRRGGDCLRGWLAAWLAGLPGGKPVWLTAGAAASWLFAMPPLSSAQGPSLRQASPSPRTGNL